MTKGYGYNADILTMLNIQQFSVADCEVRPVYKEPKQATMSQPLHSKDCLASYTTIC